MALVLETGAGVSGANTVVLVADVAAYATLKGLTWPNAATTTALQEAAVLRGMDYLRNESRFRYRGLRASATQRIPFPRTGVTMLGGLTLPDGTIPQELKDAQCELAIRAAAGSAAGSLADIQPDVDRGGRIKRSKIDVLETEYFDDASSEKTLRVVDGLLAVLVRKSGSRPGVPFLSQPEYDPPLDDSSTSTSA